MRAHGAAIFTAAAERVVELPYGLAIFNDTHPRVGDLNAVRVAGEPPPDILEQVERIQVGRPHRQVEFEGEHPEPPGWKRDRFVHLRFDGARPAAPRAVAEVSFGDLRGLREEWVRDEVPHAAEWILAGDEVLFTATPTRAFAVRDVGGRPVAMALLVDDGPVQMVEDVYTTPARRRQGLAGAVVRTAVAAAIDAGAELVHIPADAGGAPQRLYERLGFTVVALTTRLIREVGPE